MMTCWTQLGALLEQAAQQMRLARAGIALHQEAGRQQLSFLPDGASGPYARSALASSFVAALELAKQGRVELKQQSAFAPLYLKAAG
jgi:chromatin segregation and condensation protein Rec8/ScpA/Scc1 (kleisin family)